MESVSIQGGCSKLSILYKDKLFSCLMGQDLSITVYDNDGCTNVYTGQVDLKEIKKRLNDIMLGKKVCSVCGQVTKKPEYYFAGVYCTECWNKNLEEDRKWSYNRLD